MEKEILNIQTNVSSMRAEINHLSKTIDKVEIAMEKIALIIAEQNNNKDRIRSLESTEKEKSKVLSLLLENDKINQKIIRNLEKDNALNTDKLAKLLEMQALENKIIKDLQETNKLFSLKIRVLEDFKLKIAIISGLVGLFAGGIAGKIIEFIGK